MNIPVEPRRAGAPVPVQGAVKLMYGAAAVLGVSLIVSVSLIGELKAALRRANPSLTAAQIRDLNGLITLAIVIGLVMTGLWLWLAWSNGQGRNWARILATVLSGLATLGLISQYPGRHVGHLVLGGQAQPVIHYGFGMTVLAVIVPALTWLAGLAAVWLLWRPASSVFFSRPDGQRGRRPGRRPGRESTA